MGALTKLERDDLEELFLSIHSSNNRYKKLHTLGSKKFQKLIKQARYELNRAKLSHSMYNILQKKKILSK